jgi:adenylate cyclase
MTRWSTRMVMLCGLVPTLLTGILAVSRPASLVNLERTVYDTLLRASPVRPPDTRIVVVDVDERSLATIGQWPWRRDRIGELIARLRDLGAAVVALDIMFPEPDREQGTGTNPDVALADTLRAGRVILGYGLTFDGEPGATASCVAHPIGLAIVRRAHDSVPDPFFRATGAICNLEMLTTAAGVSGFLNAAPDSDGILRRAPLLAEVRGRVYPSLGVAAVRAVTGTRDLTLNVSNVNASSLALGERHVPIDGRSNLLLRYRGPKRTFPYLSAADVLSGRVAREAVSGKLVLVGTTALGNREVVSTPLDTLFTGVEVQATVADNLLQQDFIQLPEHEGAIETLMVLALGMVAILLTGRYGATSGAIGAGACLAALWGASAWLMATSGIVLSPLYPTIGVIGGVAMMTVTSQIAERRRADRAGEERATSQRLMIQTLLSLTEIRDAETGQHSRRTQQYTRVLAQALSAQAGFSEYLTGERIDLLATLAPLHDIGKVGVPDQLLRKPGALTPDELAEIQKHPIYGRDVIVNAQRNAGVRHDVTLELAKDIVYTHHEKWDGTGYPEALRGADIPIPGRVMAVVDVYDALRSVRPYSQPLSHDAAVVQIVRRRGTHFDPAVVDAFLRVSEDFQRLSDA